MKATQGTMPKQLRWTNVQQDHGKHIRITTIVPIHHLRGKYNESSVENK